MDNDRELSDAIQIQEEQKKAVRATQNAIDAVKNRRQQARDALTAAKETAEGRAVVRAMDGLEAVRSAFGNDEKFDQLRDHHRIVSTANLALDDVKANMKAVFDRYDVRIAELIAIDASGDKILLELQEHLQRFQSLRDHLESVVDATKE